MKNGLSLFGLLAILAVPTVEAAEIGCPDLAQAVQVASCPSDEELRYTFTGYCSDNNRSYKGDADVCTDFERYRRLKNVALWESADGNFSAYVSCDRAPASVRSARPGTVRVARQGSITILSCGYGDGLTFSHRTRGACRVGDAAKACGSDNAACRANCD